MSRRLRLWLILALGLVQLAAAGWGVLGHERILERGEAWRFRIEPRDPADPFRGRYLALRFVENEVPISPGLDVDGTSWFYLPLGVGEGGFGELGPAAAEPPADGPFLRVSHRRVWELAGDDGGKLRIHLPFDRLYLEESRARRTDSLFRHWRQTEGLEPPVVWAVVRVLDGRSALEDVMVDGRPIREVVDAGAAGGDP